jgi:hypothetical protein
MRSTTLPCLWLLLASSACHASNCDSIRDQIDAKLRAAGVTRFTLNIVDAAAAAPGRNVGSCERGGKKILYTAPGAAETTSATSPAAKPNKRPEAVLTECKDGKVILGGDCTR